jgi:hypothetical protein
VQVGQEDRRLLGQAVGHHGALIQLQVQRRLDLLRLQGHSHAGGGAVALLVPPCNWLGSPWSFHRQQVPGQLEQLSRGQAAVALAAGLQQGVVDAGPQANRGGRLNPKPGGDGIGGAEADAADVPRQAIGVLRHHLHGVIPIRLEDPHRPGGTDAMAVQEHHDFPHHLLIGPGLGDAAGAHLADARHLPQAFGGLFDHLKHLGAKGATNLLA